MPTEYISREPLHPEQWVSLLFVLLCSESGPSLLSTLSFLSIPVWSTSQI